MTILRNSLATLAFLSACNNEAYDCDIDPNPGAVEVYTYDEVDQFCMENPNETVGCLRSEYGSRYREAYFLSEDCGYHEYLQEAIFTERTQTVFGHVAESYCLLGGGYGVCVDPDEKWEW